ncbi:hypothetical protein EDD16DRAFT_1515271 [Pisolithus croceorrhizus]|nr:hypothetical protein EDD16DRAFT_1515271 [Pisolithus croceorrhizus]
MTSYDRATYLEQHVTSAAAHQDIDCTVLHPSLARIFKTMMKTVTLRTSTRPIKPEIWLCRIRGMPISSSRRHFIQGWEGKEDDKYEPRLTYFVDPGTSERSADRLLRDLTLSGCRRPPTHRGNWTCRCVFQMTENRDGPRLNLSTHVRCTGFASCNKSLIPNESRSLVLLKDLTTKQASTVVCSSWIHAKETKASPSRMLWVDKVVSPLRTQGSGNPAVLVGVEPIVGHADAATDVGNESRFEQSDEKGCNSYLRVSTPLTTHVPPNTAMHTPPHMPAYTAAHAPTHVPAPAATHAPPPARTPPAQTFPVRNGGMSLAAGYQRPHCIGVTTAPLSILVL